MAYNKKSSARENRSQREGNIPGGPRPATMKIGDDLEYRIARLFVFMGYFVRRSRPIFTAGALDQATDLDVVAIRYTEPFRRQVITVECKSGGEGPLDRIFWLGGVKKYVSADEAILIRKGTKWNIKDFAKEAEFNCGIWRKLPRWSRPSKLDRTTGLASLTVLSTQES
jgi:hypothetical protein